MRASGEDRAGIADADRPHGIGYQRRRPRAVSRAKARSVERSSRRRTAYSSENAGTDWHAGSAIAAPATSAPSTKRRRGERVAEFM